MNPSSSRLKRWLFRPIPLSLIAILLVVVTALSLVAFEQKRLVNIALGDLNEKLHGDLTIENTSVSLTKHFPYISVILQEAKLFPDKSTTGKPICELERLYVGFSLMDILQGKYNVRVISVHGAHLNLIRNLDGILNLDEAIAMRTDSTSDSTSDTAAFEINLHKIVLKESDISFFDETSRRTFSGHIDKFTSGFKLEHHQMTLTMDTEMILDLVSPNDSTLFRHKRFELETEAVYKEKEKSLTISSGKLKLQDASFNIEGAATLGDQPSVDFKIKGDKPDFALLEAFLPGDVKTTLKPFRYDGRIHFEGTVRGDVSNDALPLIEVSFGCEDAWFHNTGANRKVDQLTFKGFYTNGDKHSLQTSELHVTNISARPEKGLFKGNFIIRDFTNPHTLVQITSDLELKFLGEFLGIQDLKQTTGRIKLDMHFKELDDIQLPEQSLNKLKEGIQSNLTVEGLSFNIPGYPYPVRDMNLHGEMENGKITIDSTFLRIGNSEFHLGGSISDIHGFLHDRAKIITLTLNASSKKIDLHELLSYDTALARKFNDEVHGFNVNISLQTSFDQLLHPDPLPKGQLDVRNLRASFKTYPHEFKGLGASLQIGDTVVKLQHFAGVIDSSDFNFSGHVNNFHLWFKDFKKGRTQIAFDFKSNRFKMADVLDKETRLYIPRGYRHEEAKNTWLQAKVDLRYDTVFKFAKADIVNITSELKKHQLVLKDIKGKVKYGASKLLVLDTLTGSIGKSDFDISMRLFAGTDKKIRKKTNYLQLKSKFIDGDEMSQYKLAPSRKKPVPGQPEPPPTADTLSHASSFNIFLLPFNEFNLRIDVAKIKYDKLWLKDVAVRMRLQEDHFIYVDTMAMRVAGGIVSMTGVLNGHDPEKIFFQSTIDVDQIDLEKLLIKMDHFGQDVVVNKNIKGRLTGQITSYVQVHPNLVPILSKTNAKVAVTITDGSLVDFAPMQAMAGYFKDKNLRLIRFDTLHNQLTFNNGVLDIPSMSINSSLGYIEMSGKQSMDLNMEYYIRVPMKMVTQVGFNSLFDKKPEEVDLAQVDAIEPLDKDRKVRFMNLKVIGKPEDFKVGLGKDKRHN